MHACVCVCTYMYMYMYMYMYVCCLVTNYIEYYINNTFLVHSPFLPPPHLPVAVKFLLSHLHQVCQVVGDCTSIHKGKQLLHCQVKHILRWQAHRGKESSVKSLSLFLPLPPLPPSLPPSLFTCLSCSSPRATILEPMALKSSRYTPNNLERENLMFSRCRTAFLAWYRTQLNSICVWVCVYVWRGTEQLMANTHVLYI